MALTLGGVLANEGFMGLLLLQTLQFPLQVLVDLDEFELIESLFFLLPRNFPAQVLDLDVLDVHALDFLRHPHILELF